MKKLDSFTLEMAENHLMRIFLRNGRLRVKSKISCKVILLSAFKIEPIRINLSLKVTFVAAIKFRTSGLVHFE